MPPFTGIGYSTSDVYRVSAGGPGRLVVEAENQSVKVSVFNTETGVVISSTLRGEGGGVYDPTGRYYYHCEDNSSYAKLYKFDTTGDVFYEKAHSGFKGWAYFGSRTVVMSEDGKHVFWNGLVFDQNLALEWSLADTICSVSGDGRYAFSQTKIYDVTQKKMLQPMPVVTAVSAFNTSTGRLVVQDGQVLGFYSPAGPGLLGSQGAPQNHAIVESLGQLQWTPIPGATSYRIYLGTSPTATGEATMASAEYLGEVSGAFMTLTSPLPAGQTYYWRVDVVVDDAVAAGAIQSFSTSTIIPSASSIDVTTVQGDANYAVAVGLSSTVAGKSWTATASMPWVKLAISTGVTPATLRVVLDASQLNAGLNQAAITMTTSDGTFMIPVSLQVDALSLTMMRSDPSSAKIYAISEAADPVITRAYLLEVDSLGQTIARVVGVGAGVTDLAVHHGDNRVYVTTPRAGSLLAVGIDSFAVERAYAVPPYVEYYSYADLYRISAGGAGRLIVESLNSGVSVFNTDTGLALAQPYGHAGGGIGDASGRYYYHADYNTSDAALHKFDAGDDKISQLAAAKVEGFDSSSDRVVVASEGGGCVFWRGYVFDRNLAPGWNVRDIIYSASGGGRYAFSNSRIYDVVQQRVLMSMPVATKVSAYNSTVGRLVVQNGHGLGFYSVVGPGLAGSQMSPQNQEIVQSPGQLQWTPLAGAASYRVYLGSSPESVACATITSPEYLGEVSNPSIALTEVLPTGHMYYWRVDVVAAGEMAAGDIQSFYVSTVIPSVASIDISTVRGNANCSVSIGLSSEGEGEGWTATSSSSWVKLASSSGVAPMALQVMLDASQLDLGLNQAGITITTHGGAFTIPVHLLVDPLAVTMMRSDPDTAKVYAISEAADPVKPRAYLLEIDSLGESITRGVQVGAGVTDLAVHRGDNRIYITNWKACTLLAVNLDAFAVERSYVVPSFPGLVSGVADAYRLSAGGLGRLMIEGGTLPVKAAIFDTQAGEFLASTSIFKEGGGCYDRSGRYYYHGGVSFGLTLGIPSLAKFDTVGDHISSVWTTFGDQYSYYYSSGRVMVSDDGRRVFWGGAVFGSDKKQEWHIGSEIYAITPDGRVAFGAYSVYDLNSYALVFPMPVTTIVSAYNSSGRKLVVPVGGALGFYALNVGQALPAPVLSAVPVSYNSVQFGWIDKALESGFTVQMRIAGSGDWADLKTASAYSTGVTVSGLHQSTVYEFRVRASSPVAISAWSNVVSVTTPAGPPVFNMSPTVVVTQGYPVNIPLSADGIGNGYTVSGLPPGVSFDAASLTISGKSDMIGHYQVNIQAVNSLGESSCQIDVMIGSTSQDAPSGRYTGLTQGEPALMGTWTINRTGRQYTGTFNGLGGKLTFSGFFNTTGDIRYSYISWGGKAFEIVSGVALWDRRIDRITISITLPGYGSATTLDDTGFVSSWNSSTHPYSQAGVFTAAMLPDEDSTVDQPEGDGFLTLTISPSGAAKLQGETALGEKVTWSGTVADNLSLPVYWQSGDSFLWGIIMVSAPDIELPPILGGLAWGKNERPSRTTYPAGFVQYLNVVGNRFQSRTNLNGFFTHTNAPVLQLGGGGLSRILDRLIQPFSISATGPVIPVNPYQMKLSINAKTGLVTGTMALRDLNPVTRLPVNRKVSFRGIMVRNADGAGTDTVDGYFLLPGWDKSVRSGWMEIMAP